MISHVRGKERSPSHISPPIADHRSAANPPGMNTSANSPAIFAPFVQKTPCKSSAMNTSAKFARNYSRMNTSKISVLQVAWNEHLQKNGEGGTPLRHMTAPLAAPTPNGAAPLSPGATRTRSEKIPPMPHDTMQALEIRPATEADVPLVLELIRKLAEYGDLASEVSTTETDVRAALFGPERVAHAVIAYVGSEPAGFALYTYTFASFLGRPGIFVEDLFVEQARRGAGIGKALLCHLARLGRQRGCGRLEWAVLNWNEQAMEFYQNLGAVPLDEWTTFRLTGGALEQLASQAAP
jgi:GNAT superfamily N-acetyltransferase